MKPHYHKYIVTCQGRKKKSHVVHYGIYFAENILDFMTNIVQSKEFFINPIMVTRISDGQELMFF